MMSRKVVALRRDPDRTSPSCGSRPSSVNVDVLRALFLDRYNVPNFHLERRDIHLAVIHENVAVIDDLTSLTTRGRKAGSVHDVVQAALEHEQKVLARNALLTKCLFEIIPKLFLEDEVNALYFLLFAELLAVSGEHLAAGGTVLSRRIGTALFDRA